MTTCADVQIRLSAFVDDDLDWAERQLVAGHLDQCAACSGIARDLATLRRAALSLGPIDPPARVFDGLATRTQPQPARSGWLPVAAAVAVVLAGAYGVVRLDRGGARPSFQAGNVATPKSVEAPGDEWHAMLAQYETAISALEQATAPEQHRLEPKLAATLHSDLSAIDAAIAQSRAAVTADPTDPSARDSLSESLQRKVTVLQATAAVISETPQGDQ